MEDEQEEFEVSEDFEACLKLAAEMIAQYAADQTKGMQIPLPPQAYHKKFQDELYHGLIAVFKKLRLGYLHLFEYLIDLSAQTVTHEMEGALKSITQMTAIASVLSDRKNDYIKLLQNNMTLQQIFSLDDTALHALYLAAKYIYEQQNYKEACSAFALLALLNPLQTTFWIALGNCEYFCHNYEGAVLAYTMASKLDPLDPTSHFFSSKCFEATRDISSALSQLDLALAIIDKNPQQVSWKAKVEQEKMRLSQKVKEA